jgi:hypothetical protein
LGVGQVKVLDRESGSVLLSCCEREGRGSRAGESLKYRLLRKRMSWIPRWRKVEV